jgi:hypothetical protein
MGEDFSIPENPSDANVCINPMACEAWLKSSTV